MGYELFTVAIIELIIFIIVYRTPKLGKKYAPAVTGFAGFLVTFGGLFISQGYIPPQYSLIIIGVGLFGILAVYLVASNFIIRVGPLKDFFKYLTTVGWVLAIIMPILYAIIISTIVPRF